MRKAYQMALDRALESLLILKNMQRRDAITYSAINSLEQAIKNLTTLIEEYE